MDTVTDEKLVVNNSSECDMNHGNERIIDVPLSIKLKEKNTISTISIDKRANIIVVVLTHDNTRKTIVSAIFRLWSKTISEFTKQAKRKNLSDEEIFDITDCLDDNHEVILDSVTDNRIETAYNDENWKSKEKQEILDEIERIRSSNTTITADIWQNKLEGKYNRLLLIVHRHTPNLWPHIEFELSILRILNLKDCNLPFAGIILGPPSSLKTQAIELLRNWPHTFYTDNFSAKSFVSHTTSVTREQLSQIDLLPKIKNKCFLTPELSPTFATKDEDLVQILGIMTMILDGNGYESDSGAQGHRGYSGEMIFSWIGAAVDIPHKVYKLLGTLGPKVYFFRPRIIQKTEEEYVEQTKKGDFGKKIAEIKQTLLDYLQWFEIGPGLSIDKENGLVKMAWNSERDDEIAITYIVRLARLLAHLRGVAPTWNTYGTQGSDYSYTLPSIEEPDRAMQQLTNLARGHALSQGRNYITLDDIPIVINVVLSTASKERVTIFDLLLAHNGTLTTTEISKSLSISAPTARRTMLELCVLRLVDNIDDTDSVRQISLKPEINWVMSDDFRRLRERGMEQGSLSTTRLEGKVKEKMPLSKQEFAILPHEPPLLDKDAAFWNIYDKLEEEQKGLRNHMEVDKTTISGEVLKQRLVSSGRFYTSDAALMLEKMVSKGELKEVIYDTYIRIPKKHEIAAQRR
jgi:hypothetical protein